MQNILFQASLRESLFAHRKLDLKGCVDQRKVKEMASTQSQIIQDTAPKLGAEDIISEHGASNTIFT